MITETKHVYKIKRQDGLFSTGGYTPRWNKKGKTWNTLGALNSHLGLAVSHNGMAYGRIDINSVQIVRYEVQQHVDAVLNMAEHVAEYQERQAARREAQVQRSQRERLRALEEEAAELRDSLES